MDLESAAPSGAVIRSSESDATGWRWRAAWGGVELAAWNDIDGVAVVADIGPWDEWVGLAGHPPDPSAEEALAWAVTTISDWIEDPAHAERIRFRGGREPGSRRGP